MFDILTKQAEALLQDIIDHRSEDGIVDTTYFFSKLNAMNWADENIYRSCFKELSDHGLVITKWADGGPYMIILTSTGLEYFDQKNTAKKEVRKARLSSHWHDVRVSAISAIFGGIVTFLLFKWFGIA